MARILVLYGTSEGHTATIAQTIAHTLMEQGFEAEPIRAGAADPQLTAYDGVIVAASIHGGHFQKPLVACVRKYATPIAARPNAFLPVCLGILQKDNPKVKAELDATIQRFSHDSGWVPARVKFVAGALLYRQYNFFVRWMMKRIVRSAGGDTDTSKDYVYTDWADVRSFATEFGRALRAAA